MAEAGKAPPPRLQPSRRLSIWWRRAKANPMAVPVVLIAIGIIIFDQLSKMWILHGSGIVGPRCTPQTEQFCGHMEISAIFDLTMVWNQGISFGLFSEGLSTRIAAWIVIAALAGGLVYLFRVFSQPRAAMLTAGIAIAVLMTDIVIVVMSNLYSGLFVWMTSRISLSIISISVAVGLIIALPRIRQRLVATGIGFIIGGALGNVIDRIAYGAVVDFLNFSGLSLFGSNFPWIFNIADAAINIGVACLLIDTFFLAGRREQEKAAADRNPAIK